MQKITSNTTETSNNNIQEELKQYKDIDYSSESSRMRYLIKKNEEENIDFISTLIRLKGRNVYSNINPNEKLLPNIQQNVNSITNGIINYGNSNSNNKTEDESKSYIKEILDVCGSSGSTNVIGNDTFDIDNEINSITPRRIEPKKESVDNSNNVITNEINDINNTSNINNDNLHKGVLNKMFKEAEEIEKMLTQKQYLNSTNKKKTNVKVFSHKTDKYGIPISHSSKSKERNIHNNNNNNNDIQNEVKHSKTNTKSTIISNHNNENSEASSVVKISNVSDKNDVEVVNNNNTQIWNDNDNNNNTNSKTIFNPDNNYFTNIIQEENIKLSVELSEKTQSRTKAKIIETTEINLFDDDNDDITNNNNEIEQGKIQYNMIKQYPNIKESKTIAHIVNSVEPIEEKKIEIDLDDLLTPKYIFSSNASSLNNNCIHNNNNKSNNNNLINKNTSNTSKHIIIQSHSSSALHVSSSHQTNNNNNENNNPFLRHVSKSFCSFIPPSHNEVNNNNNNYNNNTNGCLLSHKKEKKQQNEFETIQHQTNNIIKGNSTRPTTTKQQNQSLRKSQPIIKNTKKNADINKKTLSVIKKKKYKFEPLSRKRGTPAPQMKKQIFNININVNKSVKNPKVGKITINNTNKDEKKDVVKSSNISLDNYFKNIFSQEPSKKTNKLVKRTNNSRKGTVNATSKSSSSSKIISLLNTSENVAVDTITAYNNNINSHNNG
jgi:hypothetical protein